MTATALERIRAWGAATVDRFGETAQPEILATSVALSRDPAVRRLLGAAPAYASRIGRTDARLFVGWGRRPSGRRAERLARENGGSVLLLEDGFVRSALPADPPLSLLADDLGVHYDATGPSRLEALIGGSLPDGGAARAQAVAELWVRGGLTRHTGLPTGVPDLPDRFVLVADQVAGDLSIRFGLADAAAFDRALDAALTDFPDLPVIVKSHPAADGRRRRGVLAAGVAGRSARVIVLDHPLHPAPLIDRAAAVYTVTSQLGFEALIRGRPVHCFGMPFYAGWGLTTDSLPAPDRRCRVTLDQLVHAALVDYPAYFDPRTGAATAPETVFAHLGGLDAPAATASASQRFSPRSPAASRAAAP